MRDAAAIYEIGGEAYEIGGEGRALVELVGKLLAEIVDNRELLDLQAQIDMAFWAGWMFWATVVGMLISSVAVAAAYLSLKASRGALELSRKAAADAREIGEFQTQAYAHAAGASFGENSNVLITVRNGGLTPATHFGVNAAAKLVARGEVSKSISFPEDGFKIWSALGANDELAVSILEGDPAISSYLHKCHNGEILLISGQILYCTVFNHYHVTQFAFYADRRTPKRFRRPTANLVTFRRIVDGQSVPHREDVNVRLDEND